MNKTIFDDIVSGEMKSWTIWQDEDYIAFLSIFPNTPGHTVVAKKDNPGDYVFSVDDESFDGIMKASRTVAKILEKAFNTDRVGLIFHGLGVPHLHAQLVPFHANLDHDQEIAAKFRQVHPEFTEHLTSSDGPKMDDEELDKILANILEAQK